MSVKIGIISLGCPKNQVDAERIIAALEADGMEIVDYMDGADALIINTCCFIDSAKIETIESIFDAVDLKNEGIIDKIIVTGCLGELHGQETLDEIPEIDGIFGIGCNADIAAYTRRVIEGESIFELPPKTDLPLEGERVLTTPPHYAYLKIAEGCSNCCSYCVIPSIRGEYRSRSIENIKAEAQLLADKGVKELILVAQDTTSYGIDIYGELKLPELLKELSDIKKIKWIRLLYCYPDKITDALIEEIANNDKVVKYIDLPIQHADDDILKAMNRRGDSAMLRETIEKLRSGVPDIIIRTTILVGFPGEGEDEFENLCAFINEMEFDKLGCFAFSPQEGTLAYDMESDIDDDTKERRVEVIMQDQYEIMKIKRANLVAGVFETVVEGYDGYTDSYFGRAYMDAPDIDSIIKFTSSKTLNDGDFVDVEILGEMEYDLIGRAVN